MPAVANAREEDLLAQAAVGPHVPEADIALVVAQARIAQAGALHAEVPNEIQDLPSVALNLRKKRSRRRKKPLSLKV